MIAVDTSAIVAIVFGEPERRAFLEIIQRASKALISSVSVVEARLVVYGRRGQRGIVIADDILRLPVFEIVPPGRDEMEAAYAAFVAYGKRSGHPANLNFGDLFSYALAKVRGVPLLFKGDDFARTDIQSAAAL
ncbi:MAG TPA: type II toxin-antitoxin system VapC family toxin [Stellaceae bacterium]|nr:type II toxin-antitoxin system VapC family toxin [Stellaceae bacterium]